MLNSQYWSTTSTDSVSSNVGSIRGDSRLRIQLTSNARTTVGGTTYSWGSRKSFWIS